MSFTSDFDPLNPVSPLQAASRFDHLFDVYGLSLKHEAGQAQQKTVTLIARSPASPPAQALAMNLGRFRPHTISVRIIFAQIAPASALNFIFQVLSSTGCEAPEGVIRWAKNRALLEAHERLTLGQALCWTGDSMRRPEDSRSALDQVEEGSPAITAEAHASFEALWAASKPLPKTIFSRGVPAATSPLQEQALLETVAAEQNVVRLQDYLRARRH
jgi:hypothetical protein